MGDYISQRLIEIPVDTNRPDLIRQAQMGVERQIRFSDSPIRFAVTGSGGGFWTCEVGALTSENQGPDIFDFRKRTFENAGSFNVVMLVPTGIGSAIGGHAGDATPSAILLSSVCDTLITHPNVLNASDIIQIPPNALYVEGSVITQLMMGTIGLRRVRNNRLLVLAQGHHDPLFTNAAINSVNAARSSYGLNASVVVLDQCFKMRSEYTRTGGAAGSIEGIEYVYNLIDARQGEFDAVAITSVIELPPGLHENYFLLSDEIVNPWGGVEAMLTHAVSLRYGLPSAHAPMLESRAIAEMDFGVVDPRMAAEVISLAFFQCVLRGLQYSPKVSNISRANSGNCIWSEDISCLVIPDGCIGLPTLAALANGIPVIAVRSNSNQMHNDLEALPWARGQLFRVGNYLEAAGVVSALRAGIDPRSTMRPLEPVVVERSSVLGEELPVVTSGWLPGTGDSHAG